MQWKKDTKETKILKASTNCECTAHIAKFRDKKMEPGRTSKASVTLEI